MLVAIPIRSPTNREPHMSPLAFRARAVVAGLAVLAAVIVAHSAPASAPVPTADPQLPRLHLSWRAPHGLARAADSIGTTCADSSRTDTLWLSFEPSRDETAFVALGGEIEIHGQPGVSLGAFWHMSKGGANRGGLILQLGPDPSMPGESPWPMPGLGVVDYRVDGATARLGFGCTLGNDSKAHLRKGRRYTVGRVLVRGISAGLPGCDAPVCFEWRRAEFVFGGGRDFWTGGAGHALATRGAADAIRRERLASAPVPTTPAAKPAPPAPAPVRVVLERSDSTAH